MHTHLITQLVGTWNVAFQQKSLEPPAASGPEDAKPRDHATEALFQVFANMDIAPGSELLADYGPGFMII